MDWLQGDSPEILVSAYDLLNVSTANPEARV
jgi:hypothetical protein